MQKEWMDKIKAPQPSTLVDRLRGFYPSAVSPPYPTSPIDKEAADEIEFLHALLAKYNIDTDKYRPNQQ